jgi:hypothetical protein
MAAMPKCRVSSPPAARGSPADKRGFLDTNAPPNRSRLDMDPTAFLRLQRRPLK